MKKLVLFVVTFQIFFVNYNQLEAGKLTVTTVPKGNEKLYYKKIYFAGGCFWCMEESFDQVNGVISTISGYSGGHLKNPSYHDVIYKDTGHVEAIEITYDSNIVNYENLLNIYWKNIDPFDSTGQFCDKGKSYRSVIFFQTQPEKEFIDKSFKKLERLFNNKIVTLVWKFEKFYPAEDYHQDYYEKNFIRYLMYKKGCKREETLKKIWN
jgi:peptide-methionine (S)-S-oxide reductase